MSEILSVNEIKNCIFTEKKEIEAGEAHSARQLLPSADGEKDYAVIVFKGYGKRQGVFDKIGGIVYRIWNFVKAIFGKSDWQRARKETIAKINHAYTVSRIELARLDPKEGEKIKKWFDHLSKKIADSYLDDLVACSKIKAQNCEGVAEQYEEYFNEKYSQANIEKLSGNAPAFVTSQESKEVQNFITNYIKANKILEK